MPDTTEQLKGLQCTITALEVDLSSDIKEGSQAYDNYVNNLAKHAHLPTLIYITHSLSCIGAEVDNNGKYTEDSKVWTMKKKGLVVLLLEWVSTHQWWAVFHSVITLPVT